MKNYLLIFFSICVFNNLSAQLFGGQIKSNRNPLLDQYPIGSIFCVSGPTVIVPVINPTTGKTWMDRNLGAAQAATNYIDINAIGDLYQWGRRNDGHQCRNSSTTSTLSSVDQPSHASFILLSCSSTTGICDWRTPQNNNLWQGVAGVNNPCPLGYRIPTSSEWVDEINSWSNPKNNISAFNSPLKLTSGGYRRNNDGSITHFGSPIVLGTATYGGSYWSSTAVYQDFSSSTQFDQWYSSSLEIQSNSGQTTPKSRLLGFSIRCIKN